MPPPMGNTFDISNSRYAPLYDLFQTVFGGAAPNRDESGQFGGMGFSPGTEALGEGIQRAADVGFDRQQQAFKGAASTIRGTGSDIENLYSDFSTRLNEMLPDQPFTDEMRRYRMGGLTSRLNRDEQLAMQNFRNTAVRRGLSPGGGQSTQAATDIRMAKTGQRQQGMENLLSEQSAVNSAMAKFKAGIESGLTVEQAGNMARLGLAEGGVQMTGALAQDPTFTADLMSELWGVQTMEDINAQVQEALESNDPDFIQQALESISQALLAQGNPGGSIVADFFGGLS